MEEGRKVEEEWRWRRDEGKRELDEKGGGGRKWRRKDGEEGRK